MYRSRESTHLVKKFLDVLHGKQILTLVNNYSTARESRILKKLMTGSSKAKKKWYNVDQPYSKTLEELNFFAASSKLAVKAPPITKSEDAPSINTVSAEKARMPAGRVVRRVGVLNTVFLEHITSILSTGEIPGSEALIGLGLEITCVQVTSDFKNINVFWYVSGSEEKEIFLEGLLKSIARKLRQQLTALRVIGIVPPIEFVKDYKYRQLVEVERLLEKADYGDDFVPTSGASLFQTNSTISSLSPELKSKIEQPEELDEDTKTETNSVTDLNSKAENETVVENEISISPLDPQFMRQDMLGLNRDKIMNQITELVTRSQKKQSVRLTQGSDSESGHEKGQSDNPNPSSSREQLAITLQKQASRTAAFVEYIKRKQRDQMKAQKRLSTDAYDQQFYDSLRRETMLKSNQEEVLESENQFYNDELEDYLSEDENN